MKKIILPLFILFACADAFSQNKFICIVKDGATKEMLPGVNVVLDGTTNGVATDIYGKAILKNIPNGQQTIDFTFIGYKTITS